MGLFSTLGKIAGGIIGGPTGAAIGGGIGGAIDGSKSSKKNKNAITAAQQAQIDASNRIIDLQEQRYGDATRNFNPVISSGNAALDQINALLGIAPTPISSGASGAGTSAPSTSPTSLLSRVPTGPNGAPTGAAPLSFWDPSVDGGPGSKGYYTIGSDGQPQWINWDPVVGQPYMPGTTAPSVTAAQTEYANNQTGPTGAPMGTASPVDVAGRQQSAIDALKASPLYQSLFGNGRDAILGASAATGGLRGGNVNAALGDFGRDTLAQVIQQQLANLGGLQAQGQSAASSLAGFGSTSANAIGNQITNTGNAQAGGILGRQAVVNANSSNIDNILGSLFGSIGGAGGIGSLFKGGSGGGTTSADDFLESILGGVDF